MITDSVISNLTNENLQDLVAEKFQPVDKKEFIETLLSQLSEDEQVQILIPLLDKFWLNGGDVGQLLTRDQFISIFDNLEVDFRK